MANMMIADAPPLDVAEGQLAAARARLTDLQRQAAAAHTAYNAEAAARPALAQRAHVDRDKDSLAELKLLDERLALLEDAADALDAAAAEARTEVTRAEQAVEGSERNTTALRLASLRAKFNSARAKFYEGNSQQRARLVEMFQTAQTMATLQGELGLPREDLSKLKDNVRRDTDTLLWRWGRVRDLVGRD